MDVLSELTEGAFFGGSGEWEGSEEREERTKASPIFVFFPFPLHEEVRLRHISSEIFGREKICAQRKKEAPLFFNLRHAPARLSHRISGKKCLIDGPQAIASKINMPSVPLAKATTTYTQPQ